MQFSCRLTVFLSILWNDKKIVPLLLRKLFFLQWLRREHFHSRIQPKESTSESLKLLFLSTPRKFAGTTIYGPVILKLALISAPPALFTCPSVKKKPSTTMACTWVGAMDFTRCFSVFANLTIAVDRKDRWMDPDDKAIMELGSRGTYFFPSLPGFLYFLFSFYCRFLRCKLCIISSLNTFFTNCIHEKLCSFLWCRFSRSNIIQNRTIQIICRNSWYYLF